MKTRVLIGLPLLLAATPAFATGGFECRAVDRSGIVMNGTVGHTIGSPLVAARLRVGGQTLATNGVRPEIAVGRSWIDAREIRVDLVDANAMRFEAQLRARIMTRIGATGTLVRNGVTHPVRCTME